MRLPLIKHVNKFVDQFDEDFIHETIAVLEHTSESSNLKDEELDTIGELLSTFYGVLEVRKLVSQGMSERDALNTFMQRVVGSIDQ